MTVRLISLECRQLTNNDNDEDEIALYVKNVTGRNNTIPRNEYGDEVWGKKIFKRNGQIHPISSDFILQGTEGVIVQIREEDDNPVRDDDFVGDIAIETGTPPDTYAKSVRGSDSHYILHYEVI